VIPSICSSSAPALILASHNLFAVAPSFDNGAQMAVRDRGGWRDLRPDAALPY
jgi:hypothetical protein